MASNPNEDIKLNKTEARQGSTRPNLVYVLGAGVVLVIVVFAAVWLMQGH